MRILLKTVLVKISHRRLTAFSYRSVPSNEDYIKKMSLSLLIIIIINQRRQLDSWSSYKLIIDDKTRLHKLLLIWKKSLQYYIKVVETLSMNDDISIETGDTISCGWGFELATSIGIYVVPRKHYIRFRISRNHNDIILCYWC